MDTKAIEWLERVMSYYSSTHDKTWRLHKHAVHNGLPALSVVTHDCAKALHEVVSVLNDMHDSMLEEAGAVKIPIKDMDKPHLRLVVNKK